MNGKEGVKYPRKKIAMAALAVAAILALLTALFVRDVREQLWEQSINTIMESTRQGCNTLKVQLNPGFASLETVSGSVSKYSPSQNEQLEHILGNYAQGSTAMGLYLEDGTVIPADTHMDGKVIEALTAAGQAKGIVDPHICDVSGVNVFDMFVQVRMQDGTKGYLVEEYEVSGIIDSFSLSFYNDTGFSYIMNSGGDVLIRSPHPNSNKTVQNLFDMLDQNNPDSLRQFTQALENGETGYAVFNYQGESTVFSYMPLQT